MCQDCGCVVVDEIAVDGVKVTASHSHSHAQDDHHHHEHHHHEHHHSHNHNGHTHSHSHSSAHSHTHTAPHDNQPQTGYTHTVEIHSALLDKNDRLAERNRGYFLAKNLLALNLLSSPGSGKTALLERMARDFAAMEPPLAMGVIVGDLATDNDAQRLRQAGVPAIQITTGNACHLEASMVAQAMAKLDLDHLQLLVIENVGNLVCPAAYDLGEGLRVALLAVTEGEDKPLKYPTLFKSAQVILITKADIAAPVEFNQELAVRNLQQVAPQAQIFVVSSRSGSGCAAFYDYLENYRQNLLENSLN
ncbi:MAG: hydrogenase nickel incorporation protein HypB [Pseudanabaenaceae cyanobacterium]|jgi:hydrogenase nickel incorporation protein HypB